VSLLFAFTVKDIDYKQTMSEKIIEIITEVAIADGYLSKNEETILRKIAESETLDADKIIANAKEKINNSNQKPEVEKIDYNVKNGLDFEKFIAKKFVEKYITIKNWRSDKFIDGRHAEDISHPDFLLISHKENEEDKQFAVECKWIKNFYKKKNDKIGFLLKENDFEKYKQYENEMKKEMKDFAIFLVIGIGGEGNKPEKLYIVKFSSIKFNFLHKDFMERFEKKDTTANFYFDRDKIELW